MVKTAQGAVSAIKASSVNLYSAIKSDAFSPVGLPFQRYFVTGVHSRSNDVSEQFIKGVKSFGVKRAFQAKTENIGGFALAGATTLAGSLFWAICSRFAGLWGWCGGVCLGGGVFGGFALQNGIKFSAG